MTDRCLDRLREENSLILSAMFRAFSKTLSFKDMGSDFMFLRTRVNSVRRNRSSASFWPIEPLSPNSLPIRSRVSAGTGLVSLPGVRFYPERCCTKRVRDFSVKSGYGKQFDDAVDGFVGAVVGGFELAVRAGFGGGRVGEAAVGERSRL